jgi:hypothetical protein
MRIYFFIIGICLTFCGLTQEVTNTNVEQALEDLAEAEELETEDDSYLQQLSQLALSAKPEYRNLARIANFQGAE